MICYIKYFVIAKVRRGRASILINSDIKPKKTYKPREPKKTFDLKISDVLGTNPFAGHQTNIEKAKQFKPTPYKLSFSSMQKQLNAIKIDTLQPDIDSKGKGMSIRKSTL